MSTVARSSCCQLEEIAKVRYVAPYNVALVHLGPGERDAAFAWLEREFGAKSYLLAVCLHGCALPEPALPHAPAGAEITSAGRVARVLFAMGRDRQLPHVLARVHARYRTPYVGMLAAAGISLAIALAMRNLVDELASLVNFGALSGFLLLHISVLSKFAIGRRSKNWVAHWLVPIAGIAVVLAIFTGMSRLATELGITWLAVGGVYGLVLKARRRGELAAGL